MFLPLRYSGYAIYDIRRLLIPKTALEERIFLEATRRIPSAFQMGFTWGEELREGALWINEKQHDQVLKTIRSNLRANTSYIKAISRTIKIDIDRFATEIQLSQGKECEQWNLSGLLEACASAVAWFATNWLNPFSTIRMAIARLLGPDEIEDQMKTLLSSETPPMFLQASIALSETKKGSLGDDAFRREWEPLFAIGDEEAIVLNPDGNTAQIAIETLSEADRIHLTKMNYHHMSKKHTLVEQLLVQARRIDGDLAAELLQAQLELLACIVWEEEERRLLQQRTYALCREWFQTLRTAERVRIAAQIPWVRQALEPYHMEDDEQLESVKAPQARQDLQRDNYQAAQEASRPSLVTAPVPLVSVFIEVPIGGGIRHSFETVGELNIEAYPGCDIVPALSIVAYGCLPDTYNPVDNGALDAYVLGADDIKAGDTVRGKVLGIHLRNNGDHKLLVVQTGHALSVLDDVLQLPPIVLDSIALWGGTEARSGEYWASREVAISWIHKLRI